MESKANYALVGVFVLVVLAGILSFTLWFSNAQFDQQYDEYEVKFQGAVRGLSQGSEVRFNGLPVGEVIGLGLDATDTNAVIAKIQVQSDTPVHIDSIAQLEPQGLTGLNYIQISGGSDELALMSELPGDGPHTILGKMSQIDTLVEGGEDVILGAQRALIRVNALLSEDAILNFQGILENVRAITTNLKDTDIDPDAINQLIKTFEVTAKDVSSAAIVVEKAAVDFDILLKGDVASTLRRAEVSMDEIDKTLAEFRVVANGASLVTTDLRDAINRASNSGLADLEETLDGMRSSVESLDSILKEIERNPLSFITGEEKEILEIPQ